MTIERVFVAGAGLMGHGIAQVHAAIGKRVALYEPELSRAAAGRERIAANLDRAVAKGRLTAGERAQILGRIVATDDLGAVADADLVIEAVFEDVAVKSALWLRARRLGARRAASSPRTRARSRSIGWPRLWAGRAGPGSSGCTSSARSRSCR